MSKTKLIQTRVEEEVKEEVEKILSELGLSTSQAISIFLNQVRINKGLPFEVKLRKEPNELTKRALNEPVQGLPRFNSVAALFEELKSD